MSGSRRKALRRQFKATFGRPVNKVIVVPDVRSDIVRYVPSEWRRLKGAYNANR